MDSRSILCGMLIGVIYDILRAFRRTIHSRTAANAILDTIFVMGALSTVFVFVVAFVGGRLRLVLYLGMGGGLVLYLLTLSPLVIILFGIVFGIFRGILEGIVTVIKIVSGDFIHLCGSCKRGVGKVGKQVGKNVKHRVKNRTHNKIGGKKEKQISTPKIKTRKKHKKKTSISAQKEVQ